MNSWRTTEFPVVLQMAKEFRLLPVGECTLTFVPDLGQNKLTQFLNSRLYAEDLKEM